LQQVLFDGIVDVSLLQTDILHHVPFQLYFYVLELFLLVALHVDAEYDYAFEF
jgi:hypothetical protein